MMWFIYSGLSGDVYGGPYTSKAEAEHDLPRVDRKYRRNGPSVFTTPPLVVADESYKHEMPAGYEVYNVKAERCVRNLFKAWEDLHDECARKVLNRE